MNLKQKFLDPARRINGQVNGIPSAVATQALAAAGTDFIIIDQEHAPIGRDVLHAMITATQGTGCAPLVRVPAIEDSAVKIALDAGAEGIVFPLIRSVEDARDAVATLRYPPAGRRGFGPFVAHARWQVPLTDYPARLGDRTVCMLLIETVAAVENIEAICAVDGIDALVLAGFDLSLELGVLGQFDHPRMQTAAARVEDAAREAGLPLGAIALDQETAQKLFEKGYRIIAGFDLLSLKAATAASVAWCRGD